VALDKEEKKSGEALIISWGRGTMGGRGAFNSAISRAMSSLERWRDRRLSRLTEAGRTGSCRGVNGRRPGTGVGADRVRRGRGGG
jgi:hypothetical protein